MRRAVGLVGIGALAAGMLACVAAGPAAAGPAAGIDASQARGSIAYLRTSYGVSEQEALRRVRLQATADTVADSLEKAAAASYGGMWIDQDHGGRLVVAATTPAPVTAVLRAFPDRDHVTVVAVSRSRAELRDIRDRLAVQLGDGPDSVLLPRVSEETNQVVVWKRDWLVSEGVRTLPAPTQIALDRVVSQYGGTVVARSMPRPVPLTTSRDVDRCHPLYCAGYGPVRGGIRLDIQRDDGSWGACTSGFNVRAGGGRYDGQAFVLTAGHCVASARHTRLDTAYHQGNLVLREEPELAVNNFPYDYALMPFAGRDAAQRWLGHRFQHNLVLAWCRNGALDSDPDTPCRNGDANDDGRVHIRRTSTADQVHAGWVVCASGAGASSLDYPDVVDSGAGQGYRPGTRCGRVTGQSNGGIDTDLCARAGDSGGPLFSEITGAGIGILEGNTQDRSGPCQAGESNNYVPLSTIFASVNGHPAALGSTFKVITTPSG